MSYRINRNLENSIYNWAVNYSGEDSNTIQSIEFSSVPVTGTYTFSIDNLTTGDITATASVADIQNALNALASISASVTGSVSAGLTVEFASPAGFVEQIFPVETDLVDADSASVTITTEYLNEGTTAANVIWANSKNYGSSSDRPNKPQIVLNIINVDIEQDPTRAYDSDEAAFVWTFQKTMTLSVNCYGEDGVFNILRNLIESIWTDTGKEYLARRGLFWRGNSEIRDLTALLDTGFEQRGQVDFDFAFTETKLVTETTDIIEEISGSMTLSANNTAFDFSI